MNKCSGKCMELRITKLECAFHRKLSIVTTRNFQIFFWSKEGMDMYPRCCCLYLVIQTTFFCSFHLTICLYYINSTDNSLTVAKRANSWQRYFLALWFGHVQYGITSCCKKHWAEFEHFTKEEDRQKVKVKFKNFKIETIKCFSPLHCLEMMSKCISMMVLQSTSCEMGKSETMTRAEFSEPPLKCRKNQKPLSLVPKFKVERRERSGQQMVQTMKSPTEQECIEIFYRTNVNPQYILNGKTYSHKVLKISYNFTAIHLYGINITFLKFLLSDTCLAHSPYHFSFYTTYSYCYDHINTEYILVRNPAQHFRGLGKRQPNLFYCMKRSQWSVFALNSFCLEYFVCYLCPPHKTNVVFQYQVMHNRVMETERDEFNKIIFGGYFNATGKGLFTDFSFFKTLYPYGTECLLGSISGFCKIKILNFNIQGEKFQRIEIKRISFEMHFRLLVQAENNLGTPFIELTKSFPKASVSFFFCFLQLHSNPYFLNNRNPFFPESSKLLVYQFVSIPLGKKVLVTRQKQFQYPTSDVYLERNSQKAFGIIQREKKQVKIEIHKIFFSGWKTHICFFGGLSIFEEDRQNIWEEVVSYCGNYSHSQSMYKQHGIYKNNHLSNISLFHSVPYISATSNLLLVVNQRHADILIVSLYLSSTHCQGIFINPCFKRVIPFQYQNNVLYQVNPNNPSLVYQISVNYLFGRNVYDPVLIKYGCSHIYQMRHNSNTSFLVEMGIFSLFVAHAMDTNMSVFFDGHNSSTYGAGFLFVNKIINDTLKTKPVQKFLCQENLSHPHSFVQHGATVDEQDLNHSGNWIHGMNNWDIKNFRIKLENMKHHKVFFEYNEWHREAELHNIRITGSDFATWIYNTTVQLQIIQKTSENHFDSFYTSLHFDSVVVIKLKYQQETSRMQFVTSVLTGMQDKCLREPVKGVIPPNYVIAIYCVGNKKPLSCPSGYLKIKNNLCLDSASSAHELHDGILFRWCNPKKNLFNYHMEWTSKLTVNTLLFSTKPLIVQLPGKITSAKFIPDSFKKFGNKGGKLTFIWHQTSGPKAKDFFKVEINKKHHGEECTRKKFTQHGLFLQYEAASLAKERNYGMAVFSRELQKNYDEPIPRTWFEALSLCKEEGFELPSITSSLDVDKILKLLNTAAKDGLVTKLFLGILLKVETNFCEPPITISECKKLYPANRQLFIFALSFYKVLSGFWASFRDWALWDWEGLFSLEAKNWNCVLTEIFSVCHPSEGSFFTSSVFLASLQTHI